MEGDEHDSDYPSSLTGQSQESASQPTSISSSKQDQERTQAKEIKSKEQGQIEIEKNIIIDDDEVSGISVIVFLCRKNNVNLSRYEGRKPEEHRGS